MHTIGDALPALFGSAPETSADLPAALGVLLNARDAARKFLSVQRAAGGPERFVAPAGWLARPGDEDAADAARTQYGFTGLLTAVTLALALQEQAEKHLDQMIQIGFGVDPVNSTIRNRLIGIWGGIHDPVQIGLDIPDVGLPFAEIAGVACLGELRTGLTQLGQAAAAMPRELLPSRIRTVTPGQGCAGIVVRIEGTGFGAVQPANAAVLFTAYQGGPVEAKVNSWSDTAIEVTAPDDVGDGPITIVGIGQQDGGSTIAAAADSLAGAASACLGPGAGRIAGTLQRLPVTTAAPMHDLQTNLFHGGKPRIATFTGNRQTPLVAMQPNGVLRLEWDVRNAPDVRIETIAGGVWIPPMNRTFPAACAACSAA